MEEPILEEQEQSSENLEELEQKRSEINSDAEKHRRLRDDLNKQTKEWASKRDALNAQVREFVEEAGKHREERDSLNQKVRESKDLRDEWNQKVTKLYEETAQFKKDTSDDKGPSLKALKKEFSELEHRYETGTFKPEAEKSMIKRMSELYHEIEEKEKGAEHDVEAKEAFGQLREAKAKAEEYHRLVSEYAEKAQDAHDSMIALYEQADRLRKEADGAQEKFVECKLLADEEHKKHIEQIKSIHEMDKDFNEIRGKAKAAKKKKVDSESKKEAKEIFERFKAGDKLSTDDLMALQKSGYL